MPFSDIEAQLTIDAAFSAADAALIKNTLQAVYDGSATARTMFDDWVAGGNTLQVDTGASPRGFFNTGRVEYNVGYLSGLNYLDSNGNAVAVQHTHVMAHEFVHAILGKPDNWNNVSDYAGDTVRFTNDILDELGLPDRNSYIGVGTDAILTTGRAYTDGAEIDRSVSRDSDWNSGPAGNSRDLLIGGASANTLQAGDGNDFVFGAGGDDTLDGGGGAGDTVVLVGKPVDYDIRLNSDGTWTSRHVRGSADEGEDTFSNLEKVHFIDADQSFNLSKSGLTFQTDFSFVVDTTGSMSDDIAAVKAAATGVIDALFNNNTIDARVNVVTYKDNTNGEPTDVVLSFTDEDDFADRKSAAVSAINSISVGGGGDFPETAFDGLLKALDGSAGEWRVGAGVKKVALFTDATAKDVALLPTVLAYALSIGATVSSSRSEALGTIGVVDTYTLSFGADTSSQFDPESEGDDVTSAPLSPIVTTIPTGPAVVQVTTIFISGFTTPDPGLAELSEETGGTVLTAANPAEVVERLLEVVTSSNYSITADLGSFSEGDTGATTVTFTVSRDRADEASTVELSTSGTANATDLSGSVPTSLSFDVDEFTRTFTIDVLGDTNVESDETFSITMGDISEPSTVIVGSADITIVNDDEETGPPVGYTIYGTNEADIITPGTSSMAGPRPGIGADTLFGMAGNDTLDGSAGTDSLIGGTGKDIMTGGEGADVFHFFAGDSKAGGGVRDIIKDFESGVDRLDLSGLHITDFEAQVSYKTIGSGLIVYVDTNDNGFDYSDFAVQLTGVSALLETDFLI